MADRERTLAAILVGGRSARMGRPKASLVLPSGRTLLEQTLEIARTFAGETIVVGETFDQKLPVSVVALADDIPGEGPLAAAATVLTRATREWVLLLACDVPQLTVDVVERLRETTDEEADVVMAQGVADDRANPLAAYYRASLGPAMRAAVDAGERSLTRFLNGVSTSVVTVRRPPSLASVNTPAEWEAFLRAAAAEKKEASEDAPGD
jgi:molybdopterin-guanine dinucleotide biosynthesis protein A